MSKVESGFVIVMLSIALIFVLLALYQHELTTAHNEILDQLCRFHYSECIVGVDRRYGTQSSTRPSIM